MSDLKLAKSGYMLSNKPDYPRTPSWPYFVWIIFLCILLLNLLVWEISFLFDAPLEEEAAWAKTPNPAKAPWYFIGLQEMLVYFDPWIAGVVLPGQILIGLVLIPYVDISPTIQGRYAWKGRRFAVAFFSFGLFLWFLLIMVGQWFRGPSWEFYWPYFDYPIGGNTWVYEGQPFKVTTATLENMPQSAGIAYLILFFTIGMIAPIIFSRFGHVSKFAARAKEYFDALGLIRYVLVQSHVLLTLFLVSKVVLRLTFGYKYILVTPWFNI